MPKKKLNKKSKSISKGNFNIKKQRDNEKLQNDTTDSTECNEIKIVKKYKYPKESFFNGKDEAEKEIITNKKKNEKKINNLKFTEIKIKDNISFLEDDNNFEYLPCRENEQKIIYHYIIEGLETNGNYNSLYIAGMPGTGKTACVKRVLRILEDEIKEQKKNQYKNKFPSKIIPKFRILFLCGNDYPIISRLYKVIYNFIFSSKNKVNSKKYPQLLENFFLQRENVELTSLNDPSNSHIILIIDEIDFIINYNKTILYNIFNWTTFEKSKLIVISISNTLNLANNLPKKIKSRMGENKLMFKPYSKEQLIKIIESKGIEYKNFEEDAIKLSCMKVAAINGDLRRIIQILARAKEIYEINSFKSRNKLIGKEFIIKACEDLFNSKLSKIFKNLQISEKILICAILSKMKDINENKIKVGDLFESKNIFFQKYNENIDIKEEKIIRKNKNKLNLSWEEFETVIYNMIRIKILNFLEKPKNNFMENFIIIKFYADEFINACNDDIELMPVINYLMNLISI